VATTLGVLLALAWPVGVIACLVWLGTAWATRYSSLAALIGICTSPIVALVVADTRVAAVAVLLAALVVWRHRENISRLIRGEESRIKLKRG